MTGTPIWHRFTSPAADAAFTSLDPSADIGEVTSADLARFVRWSGRFLQLSGNGPTWPAPDDSGPDRILARSVGFEAIQTESAYHRHSEQGHGLPVDVATTSQTLERSSFRGHHEACHPVLDMPPERTNTLVVMEKNALDRSSAIIELKPGVLPRAIAALIAFMAHSKMSRGKATCDMPRLIHLS